jgi:HSP20 family protein
MDFRFVPWKPQKRSSSLRRELDKLWYDYFGEWEATQGPGRNWTPSLDIVETDTSFVITAEVPGMVAEDIEISVQNEVLKIRGEKRRDRQEQQGSYHLVERSYGSFSRSIRLPRGIQGDEIKATCKDGVLRVTLPKKQRNGPKAVQVRTE